MEQYRTEEEQVEALRRFWNEYGRSLLAAIVIALAAGFGWQSWQANKAGTQQRASDMYQALLRALAPESESANPDDAVELAELIKSEFKGSTYAQFAAMHLAAIAVNQGNLAEAEAQLRWVLGRARGGSDVARVAQLRLARVLAAAGDSEQALSLLNASDAGPYGASYAAVRGDVLLGAGRRDEAREAYALALALAGESGQGPSLNVLQYKLQSASPAPLPGPGASDMPVAPAATDGAPGDDGDNPAGD